MRGKKNEIPCDYNKLSAEFKRRGITNAEAGELLGYSKTMFYQSKLVNGLSKPTMIALKSVLGISPEDYAPDEKDEDVQAIHKKDEREICQTDYKAAFDEVKDELYKVMYAAVYEAVKKAWSE